MKKTQAPKTPACPSAHWTNPAAGSKTEVKTLSIPEKHHFEKEKKADDVLGIVSFADFKKQRKSKGTLRGAEIVNTSRSKAFAAPDTPGLFGAKAMLKGEETPMIGFQTPKVGQSTPLLGGAETPMPTNIPNFAGAETPKIADRDGDETPMVNAKKSGSDTPQTPAWLAKGEETPFLGAPQAGAETPMVNMGGAETPVIKGQAVADPFESLFGPAGVEGGITPVVGGAAGDATPVVKAIN